ncbi:MULTISPECIES: biliverdin-producing heme oxygenase [unclassified Pseudomonas]|uniref:biliverdin-producing heme oxygenase n=1 Tax=unclassified Pseudomonas TaxID=196821 RepID=UPI0015A2EE20|nr:MULTISPECIES: biliverdin-producing heme oxygenase [unclassified Pseudomonas]NWC95998.1 biliverdin-producing heme oxygenase [Pseudomonas sp. IPO3779]NWD20395.1 biliverdin-producing heme oxygenase [Pseudomonas sp. IPO3778]
MNSIPPILVELRAATMALHRRLDTRLPFSRMDLALYRELMSAYYGFYHPLERALAPWGEIISDLEWGRRSKTPYLYADLLALGLKDAHIDALPMCPELPAITSVAEAFGALYVLEGATLGGQVLRNLIEIKIGVGSTNGGAFMNVYGVETSALWQRFLECLYRLQAPAERLAAVNVGASTFLCFEQWLDRCEVLR